MAAMDTLQSLLHSLEALKPPGASPTKITEITNLCIENVQSEATIAQHVFSQFKKAPTTHKLGVLYVVDSVTRQWISKATQSGQQLTGATAAAGTFAAGVHKMKEIIPLMMDELLSNYPDTQKEKIRKLIEIWTKSKVLSEPVIAAFNQRLDPPASAPQQMGATTASATAAPAHTQQNPPAVPVPDTNNLLAALSSLRAQPGGVPAANPQIPPAHQPYAAPPAVPSNANASAQSFASNTANPAFPVAGNGVVPPPLAYPNVNGGSIPVAPTQQSIQGIASNPQAMQVLQALMAGQITNDQASQVLQYLGFSGLPTLTPSQAPLPVLPMPAAPPAGDGRADDNYANAQQNRGRDNGLRDYTDSRDRSRSPDRGGRNYSPPNRRNSPTYDTYDPNQAEGNSRGRNGEGDRRGRGKGRGGRNDYRQRSPPAQRRQSGNEGAKKNQKNIQYDNSLPPGKIRVLSRTLFVGGVTVGEEELRSIFSRFGSVQTCVVNREKRHAFVKMFHRDDAVKAKQGMENIDKDMQDRARSTRWGVGFGPRECSDYTTGVSVIPIDTLTDADRKWVVTAENGGTGGLELESGMVLEEPDIEIGAGVSSKAISRRVGPDQNAGRGRGGFGGNRGGFQHNHHGGKRNKQQQQHHQQQQQHQRAPEPRRAQSPAVKPEANTIGVPPPVPGFGFSIPGLPNFS